MYALMVSMKIKVKNLKATVNWIGCLTSLSGRFEFHVVDLDYTCRYKDKKVNHPPDYVVIMYKTTTEILACS
jgi:hypothetical protein